MADDTSPILMWFRRDLRLADHPALTAATTSERPVIPVFIHDESVEDMGAAPRFRLGLAVEHFAQRLADHGTRLILRRGTARNVIEQLIEETGAGAVYWTRLYDPQARERDAEIKADLREAGIEAQSFLGHVIFEPWTVETKTGGFYKVYTPMWNAVKTRDAGTPLDARRTFQTPRAWPDSDDIADWDMAAGMAKGAGIVRPHCVVGEEAAQARLDDFLDTKMADYGEARDLPWKDGTSNLSENLTYGEISALTCYVAAAEKGGRGSETFRKEIVWREFAYHLLYHTPRITSDNWREDWNAFPWNEDERKAEVKAWKQGRTGLRFVDAAMREMYVTGTMHNRARMIVASYLTKHLMCHWRIGQQWFQDCLIDWDPASNALGWQWSSGSGPDATPYFRVFNPVSQLDKFDKDRAYVEAWLAEPFEAPSESALSYFDAIPERWNMAPDDSYPEPVVSHEEGRKRALEAYENRDF